MRNSILVSLLCSIVGFTQAQKLSVTGKVTDDLSASLPGATVMLMNANDSSLVNFAVTDEDGSFRLKNIHKGRYQLQITFVGFQSFRRKFEANGDLLDLGSIKMDPQTKELDEVIIEGEKAPVTVKRDTIEFNAGSFKTKANANVEDLLKKLPGLEVENDGTVKAQGEEVQRVTVDGREFFGRDPKLATRNLPADAIDKVQVFDKKSDQAVFTGIDDGQREKTINLELKEEKRNGAFGTLMAGAGTTDRFESKASVNRFTKTKQLSFLAMGNNTNDQGFSFDEYLNFSGAMQQMMSGGGGSARIELNANSTDGVPINFGEGQNGITSNYAGGINFNRALNAKTKAGGSYFYNHVDQNVASSLDRINYLPTGNYTFNQSSRQRNLSDNHRLNFTLDHKIDSANSIKFTANLGKANTTQNTFAESETYATNSILQNESDRTTTSEGARMSLNSNLLYRHRFPRKGRSISTNLTLGINNSENDGEIGSLNQFYTGTPETQNVLQSNLQANDALSYGMTTSYTEPLGGRKYLQANYSYGQSANDVNKEVWDVNGNQRIFNSQLSNKYTSQYTYNRPGLNLRLIRRKFNFMMGASWQSTSLTGDLILQDVKIDKSFDNVLPTVRFNYDFSNFKRLRIDYETAMQEPTIQELQPVLNNSDPLNLVIGNPDLRPGYSHQLRGNFSLFDPGSFVSLFSRVTATYTTDAISTSQDVDANLVRTTQPVNVHDNYSVDATIDFGFRLKKIKSRIGIRTSAETGKGITLLNLTENSITQRALGGRVTYSLNLDELFAMDLSASLERQQSLYEISIADQLFMNRTYEAETNLKFLKNYQFNTNFRYLDYSSPTTGFNQAVPLLDISVSRFLLKNNKGELKVGVRNLLDKNLSVTQTANANYLEQQTANNLSRFFMLSFTYALNKQLNPMSGTHGAHVMRR